MWKEVERGLGNIGRLRIMRELLKDPRETRSRNVLSRATGLKMQNVKDHLEALVRLGWIREYPYQPEKYRASLENLVVQVLQGFLQQLKRLEVG